jgi:hypothetical protein
MKTSGPRLEREAIITLGLIGAAVTESRMAMLSHGLSASLINVFALSFGYSPHRGGFEPKRNYLITACIRLVSKLSSPSGEKRIDPNNLPEAADGACSMVS